MYDLLLKNALNIGSAEQKVQDVAVIGNKIVKVADSINEKAKKTLDLKGYYLFPGVIDSQVHFREPGLTDKEDLDSGSRAAALGGVTTFLEMPSTIPSTTSVKELKAKIELAEKKCITNFRFLIGADGNNLDELKKASKLEYCCGISLGSSTGEDLLNNEDKLREILFNTSGVIVFHSENNKMLAERREIKNKAKSVHDHTLWRDVETAFSSTEILVKLATECKRKIHLHNISTRDEMELLVDHKDFCTVEVTAQHLSLKSPDCYDELGNLVQTNPPIRDVKHQKGLWTAVKNRTVDIISSAHLPYSKNEKEQAYPQSPSGIPGVQTLLPIMLNHINEGRLDLQHLVKLICETPADLWSLNKGYIQEGRDADFTVVDLNRVHTLSNEEQVSKCRWTPYSGKKVMGMPIYTIVMGRVVMDHGSIAV